MRRRRWAALGLLPWAAAGCTTDSVRRDRREIFIPWFYRPVAWTQSLLPGLLGRVLARGRYGDRGAA